MASSASSSSSHSYKEAAKEAAQKLLVTAVPHMVVKGLEDIFKAAFAAQKGSELRMLVTGKTGQGKSTLINGLVGAQVAPEGAGAKRCTTEVKQYSIAIEGVPVTVFDSPGLQDRTTNEEEYLQGMRDQCQKLSLVLYCTKMTNPRLTDDDKNAMVKLTRAFGENFWDYAVFVLTFANQEDVTRKDERDEDVPEPPFDDEEAWDKLMKDRFERRLQIWTKELHSFLIYEVGVSHDIVSKIPIVPTGDNKPTKKNPCYLKLPDRQNWFNVFWEDCCLRIKQTTLFLKINNWRLIAQNEDGEHSLSVEEAQEIEETEQTRTYSSSKISSSSSRKRRNIIIHSEHSTKLDSLGHQITDKQAHTQGINEEEHGVSQEREIPNTTQDSPSLDTASSSTLPPLVVNTTNNVLIDQKVTINQTFVKKVTVEIVRRNLGEAIADVVKTAFHAVVVKPVKWFFRMIKKLINW